LMLAEITRKYDSTVPLAELTQRTIVCPTLRTTTRHCMPGELSQTGPTDSS